MKKIDKRLEQILRRKAALAAGIFPGMNRARRFKDKKKDADKNSCRKPLKDE